MPDKMIQEDPRPSPLYASVIFRPHPTYNFAIETLEVFCYAPHAVAEGWKRKPERLESGAPNIVNPINAVIIPQADFLEAFERIRSVALNLIEDRPFSAEILTLALEQINPQEGRR